MDELFMRYMYYERAKLGIKSSTTEALRSFYEKNSYSLLKNDYILDNLIDLASFWNDIHMQSQERFSMRVLKKLFILNYAPNGMWGYLVSVYFMQNKDINGLLDDEKFYNFLNKIIAFIWTTGIITPGVSALRNSVYSEMINIVNNIDVNFTENKFDEVQVKTYLDNFEFYNRRPITKSMLVWWAYNNENQELIPLNTTLEIEHIYAKKRQEFEKGLSNSKNLESIGNKSILEEKINISASEYKFSDKHKYYNGFTTDKGVVKPKTLVRDLIDLSNSMSDFTEQDIINRKSNMIYVFCEYLRSLNLFK